MLLCAVGLTSFKRTDLPSLCSYEPKFADAPTPTFTPIEMPFQPGSEKFSVEEKVEIDNPPPKASFQIYRISPRIRISRKCIRAIIIPSIMSNKHAPSNTCSKTGLYPKLHTPIYTGINIIVTAIFITCKLCGSYIGSIVGTSNKLVWIYTRHRPKSRF